MTLLIRLAVCGLASTAMGFADPGARNNLGENRSGIERVQADPDSNGSDQRSTEGRSRGDEAEPQEPPSDDEGWNEDGDTDARRFAPTEPPGCVFRDRPLDLIV